MPCKTCKGQAIERDEDTGKLICRSCGEVQSTDNFENFALASAPGVYVRVGTTGVGSSLNTKDKKKYEAVKVIEDICLKLNLAGSIPSELDSMIYRITEGEYGGGNWFPILVGACAYVTMRSGGKPFPIVEVAGVIQCDTYVLGRMVNRVLEFLEVKLPSFDFVKSFERLLSKSCEYGRIGKDHVQRVREQGIFLVNCAVKWSLSTGRQPLQLVVAVLVLVAELNGLKGMGIEEVARDVGVPSRTCKIRYKELLDRLVEVAKVGLPWGNDVTAKNLVKNGAFLLKYMEMKAEAEKGSELNIVEDGTLKDYMAECLREDEMYCNSIDGNESKYFKISDKEAVGCLTECENSHLQLSLECLLFIREKLSANTKLGNPSKVEEELKRPCFDVHPMDWWDGKSMLSKKILLDQLLEKNIGPDFLPPSFVNRCRDVENRRRKIYAAKERIAKIVQPDKIHTNQLAHSGKKRKRKSTQKNFDWEDFIIETLLLHHVQEEQIETGHYRSLLDLHVFNSGIL